MSKYVCKSDKNAFLEYIILYFNQLLGSFPR